MPIFQKNWRKMEREVGLEPTTLALLRQCSTFLSYSRPKLALPGLSKQSSFRLTAGRPTFGLLGSMKNWRRGRGLYPRIFHPCRRRSVQPPLHTTFFQCKSSLGIVSPMRREFPRYSQIVIVRYRTKRHRPRPVRICLRSVRVRI